MSNENLLDGVPRDPLVPMLPGVEGWDNFRYQYIQMYRALYDAIMKIRAGEITLNFPTAAADFTPTADKQLTPKDFVVAQGSAASDAAIADAATKYIRKDSYTGLGAILGGGALASTYVARIPTENDQIIKASDVTPGGFKWEKLKLDDCDTPDDNTDLNATTGVHGLLPKLGGGTTNFFRADGSWAAPGSGLAYGADYLSDVVQFTGSSVDAFTINFAAGTYLLWFQAEVFCEPAPDSATLYIMDSPLSYFYSTVRTHASVESSLQNFSGMAIAKIVGPKTIVCKVAVSPNDGYLAGAFGETQYSYIKVA